MIETVTIKYESAATNWKVTAHFGPAAGSASRISLLTAPNTYRKSTLLGLLTRWIVLGSRWKDTRSKDFPGVFDSGSSLELILETGKNVLDHDTAARAISTVIAVSGTAFDRFPTHARQARARAYTYVGPRANGNIISRSQSIQVLAQLLVDTDKAMVPIKLEQSGVLQLLGLASAATVHFRFRPTSNKVPADQVKEDFEHYRELLERAADAGDFALAEASPAVEDPRRRFNESADRRELQELGELDGSEGRFRTLQRRITATVEDMESFGWGRIRRLRHGSPNEGTLPLQLLEPDSASGAESKGGDESQSERKDALSNLTVLTLFKLGYLVPNHLVFLSTHGTEVSTETMSSGEFHLLTSIAGVALAARDDCLIVIDEPENSLHPAWQSRFIEMIANSIAKLANVQVVIATHSPLLASAIDPEHGNILVGRRSDTRSGTEIEFAEIDKTSFGHSVDELLMDYFGLPTPRNFFFAQRLQQAVDLYALNATHSEEYRDLCRDLAHVKGQLSNEDPLQDLLEELLSVNSGGESS